jgi:hypothetical protein
MPCSDGENEDMFGGGNVSRIEDGDILASLSAWARCLNTERETLRRRLLAANVTAKAERNGHAVYGGKDVLRAWLAGPEAGIDPDALSPFQRRAYYQGELDKLKVQQERGELVPALEVEQTIGKLAKLFVLGLDTLVDTIERDVGLSHKQADRMERHTDNIREQLYHEIAGTAAAQEAEGPPKASSSLEDAAAFLLESLAKGPRPVARIVKDATRAGIDEPTLRKARARLGKQVAAKRNGRDWIWSRPKKASRKSK